MPIKDLYQLNRPVISFEVFPPKKDDAITRIYEALGQMSALCPDFISVTYSAGGSGNANRTAEVAAFISRQYGIEALAHLTCLGADQSQILETLQHLRADGVSNVLALRGDPPVALSDSSSHDSSSHDSSSHNSSSHHLSALPSPHHPEAPPYRFAEELIRDIRDQEDFCIGAACYPEGHIDCDDLPRDMAYLRRKQEAGADFLITQLFFDNDIFFRFLDKARNNGVTLPISAGVMPILGRAQIERMIFLCGASLPSGIIRLLHKYEKSPLDLRKSGIDYAAQQIDGLLHQGVDGIHIYTMNKADIAEYCMKSMGRIS